MPWQNPKNLTDALADATTAFDQPGAAALCERLIDQARRDDHPFPLEHAKRSLDSLRAQRMFPLMERLADAFIQGGQVHPRIRRQYAQALLDQGRISSAMLVLERLLADTARRERSENAEARGLMGRAFKQMYVDGHGESRRGAKTLEAAIRCYSEVYRRNPAGYLWHGANVVALLRRAESDGVRLRGQPSPLELAEKILLLAKRQDAKPSLAGLERRWNCATALEASVGLGRGDEVRTWLERYLRSEDLSAFELASTHRELVEVWRLDPGTGLGAEVLPLMEGRLLKCSGAGLAVQPAEVSGRAGTLERILGDTAYVNVNWYRRGLERCARVARVETELDSEQGFGTGFLLRGTDLLPGLGDRELLLTNAHVVSAKGVRGALRPEQARVAFKANPAAEGRRWGVRAVVRESPPEALDFSLLELDGPVGDAAPRYPLAAARPPLEDAARVYVIGHPRGGMLSLSLNDNRLLDYDDRLLHYRAPTEGGSSGSPVFNQEWELLGLHHSGGAEMARLNGKPGSYAANEGIWIEAIRKGVASP